MIKLSQILLNIAMRLRAMIFSVLVTSAIKHSVKTAYRAFMEAGNEVARFTRENKMATLPMIIVLVYFLLVFFSAEHITFRAVNLAFVIYLSAAFGYDYCKWKQYNETRRREQQLLRAFREQLISISKKIIKEIIFQNKNN
ncbi:MAG: hypothetical protein ACLFQU_13235 [Candidatus Kapaibacterium sp.]